MVSDCVEIESTVTTLFSHFTRYIQIGYILKSPIKKQKCKVIKYKKTSVIINTLSGTSKPPSLITFTNCMIFKIHSQAQSVQ